MGLTQHIRLADPVVSILIPVYKVPEKYLRKCIESCISQTLYDIEIIIVDDGSPDNCGILCENYASRDYRIKVIHKENEGLSAARNTAFDSARGNYITFLDGDDYLESNACEIAVNCAEKHNAQVVLFNYITEYSKISRPAYSFENEEIEFLGEECKLLQERVLDFNGKIAQVFCKLIERDFLVEYKIKHIDHLKQGAEGLVFNIALFEHVKRAYYIPTQLLHYTYNENSISHTSSEENNYMVVRCFEYIKEFIRESDNRNSLEKALHKRMLYVICTTAITGYFNPDYRASFRVKKKQFKKFMKEPLVNHSMHNSSWEVQPQRKIVLLCVRLKQYWLLSILGTIRRKQLARR